MIVRSVFNPVSTKMKKCLNVMRSAFTHIPATSEASSAKTGSEILAEQNKVIVKRAANQIEPLQTKFASTKDMLKYSKERIIDTLKKSGKEHTIIIDLKKNEVLAEYIGDKNKCSLENLKDLPIDKENTAILHGHPDSYPLSRGDVMTLLEYDVNQIIAIDINGEFSLISKQAGIPAASVKSKPAQNFHNECMANLESYYDVHCDDLLKELTHETLKHHAKPLGLRYVTNYGYLTNKARY